MAVPLAIANAKVLLHLQKPWQQPASSGLGGRFSLRKEGDHSVALWDDADQSASRRKLDFDAVYDTSVAVEDVCQFSSIGGIGKRVLEGGNAAVTAFGLDRASMYNRQGLFSAILRSVSRSLESTADNGDISVSCCYVACTDSKLINLMNDRPLNGKQDIDLNTLLKPMSLEVLDAKVSEGSSLPYVIIVAFEHSSAAIPTGYLLLADWGNPAVRGASNSTAADISQFVHAFRTAAGHFTQTKYSGSLYPTENALASLFGRFLFGNTLATYVVDVQTVHTGPELDLLDGLVFSEGLRKIRLPQTLNGVDPRLPQVIQSLSKLRVDLSEAQVKAAGIEDELAKARAAASATEEDLRSRLEKLSAEKETLTQDLAEKEKAFGVESRASAKKLGDISAERDQLLETTKQLQRTSALKESELEQEIHGLREQVANLGEEVRRWQTSEVAARNRSEMLELEIVQLKAQIEDAKARASDLADASASSQQQIALLEQKLATGSENLRVAAEKEEELRAANKELADTSAQLRHQIQLLELDRKAAQKDVEMGKRENQVALREREAEVKALERHNQTLEKELESLRNQKGDRDAEIKQLREALLEKRSTSEKKAGSDLSAAIAERDRLALELSQLRAIALQGSKEDGKVDAVARAALEEFDKIKAARKADKERWKSEKEDLMKRLESLESDLKQQASAVAKPVPPRKRKADKARKLSESSSSNSDGAASDKEPVRRKPPAKPRARPALPKPNDTAESPAADEEMELDPSPVGGIISFKKVPVSKPGQEGRKRGPAKDKGAPQAGKRKALDPVDSVNDSDVVSNSQSKKTKVTLTRKDSNGTKKVPGPDSQENLSANPQAERGAFVAKELPADTQPDKAQSLEVNPEAQITPVTAPSNTGPPPAPGGPTPAVATLPVPPKSVLPGGGPRLGAGMVDPRKLQAILAGFNMDKLKSLK